MAVTERPHCVKAEVSVVEESHTDADAMVLGSRTWLIKQEG